jgi:porin
VHHSFPSRAGSRLRFAAIGALALWSGCAAARADGHLPAVEISSITDVLGNVDGGLKRGFRVLEKADLTAYYAGDDHGIAGFSVFVGAQFTGATLFSERLVGDAQAVSNLDAPAGLRLSNAWVAQEFHGRGGIKAGVIDLNTEFDVQATGALFLNSSFGIGPDFSQSGGNGPSIFPTTGLGMVGWWMPGGHWQIKAGLFEGVPGDPAHPGRTSFSFQDDEGALLVAEARNQLTPNFSVGLGAWRYTASFDPIDPLRGRLSGNSGFYAIADGLLYADPAGENTGLSGWLRLGLADARINPIANSIGGGFVYTGPFGRMADQLGIGFSRVQFGQAARLATGSGFAETTFEASYSFNINSRLSLQPDLQYVVSPSGDPTLGNALVVGSRIVATW